MAVKELVDNAINDNKIVVFSKSWCPYCKNAKLILGDQQATIFELDTMDEGSAIQDYLEGKSGQRTVPNIFINQKHVGGSTDLQALKTSGKLKELLAQ